MKMSAGIVFKGNRRTGRKMTFPACRLDNIIPQAGELHECANVMYNGAAELFYCLVEQNYFRSDCRGSGFQHLFVMSGRLLKSQHRTFRI